MSGLLPYNLKHTMFCADKTSHAVSYWIMTNLTSLLQLWCWLKKENINPGYRRQVCRLEVMAENIPKCKISCRLWNSSLHLTLNHWSASCKVGRNPPVTIHESSVTDQANIKIIVEDLTRNMSTAYELHLLFQESFITYVVCISVLPRRSH